MNKEQLRMQMLAGIITEGQYKAKLNEALIGGNTGGGDTIPHKFKWGTELILPETDETGENLTGVVRIITKYNAIEAYKEKIDNEIEETGWEEAGTPKEDLVWYQVEDNDGRDRWYDEEELSEYN